MGLTTFRGLRFLEGVFTLEAGALNAPFAASCRGLLGDAGCLEGFGCVS